MLPDGSAPTQTDAAAVLAAGWPERTRQDGAAASGRFDLTNQLVNGLGVTADAGYPTARRPAGATIGVTGGPGRAGVVCVSSPVPPR